MPEHISEEAHMGTGTRVKELRWTGDTGAQHWVPSATQLKNGNLRRVRLSGRHQSDIIAANLIGPRRDAVAIVMTSI